MWRVQLSDEFTRWWRSLPADMQESLAHDIDLLALFGPGLGRPQVDSVKGSRYRNMKELRTRHRNAALRVLFAFDPLRSAILLVGGDKSGDPRFYRRTIPRADAIYARHLARIAGIDGP